MASGEVIHNEGDSSENEEVIPKKSARGKLNPNTSRKKRKHRKTSTVDPESGWFEKGEHKHVFAYSVQTACDKDGVVLGYSVHPGNENDGRAFPELMKELEWLPVEMIVGDTAYQTPAIAKLLKDMGIKLLSTYKRPQTKKGYFKKTDYVYDEYYDCFICPNNFYAKDIGTKIRAGFRQKQKDGLVIIPPFGYWKNKNTGTVEVIEEAADTVKRIYSMYLSDIGLIQIARQLTAEHRRTPAQLQLELYNRHFGNTKPYMWSFTSVKNILQDESYIGTLTNHRREITSGKTSYVPEVEYYRHENFYPPIVSREDWLAAQDLLSKAPSKSSASPPSRHRYAGLLEYADCHTPLVAINRRWKGRTRVEYICKTYMRHSKAVCPSHRIHEDVINSSLYEKLSGLHSDAQTPS